MLWRAAALLISAWLGSFFGLLIAGSLLLLTGQIYDPIWSAIPELFLVATVLVFPITTVGLVLVGIPLGSALLPYARAWWMWFVSPALGGILGGLAYLLLMVLFLRVWDLPLHGITIGATTGLLWFALARGRPTVAVGDEGNAPPHSLPG
jgi:hypothetical protein